ncbi:dienelactone hydrolase family-domain-containing protein [Apiosordaria backusii]|uniref:Dienelactone hydrolase family-domain-containing protein n=1 Tax=Apiosordaria backusii TaxID=314023 RepID=A0AA40BN28_9PEZI|nr:dienelactone hydrolase family-domain-containing protein [Apiosordaria backusii]
MRASLLSSALLLFGGVVQAGTPGKRKNGPGGNGPPVDASILAHTGQPEGKEVVHNNITIYITLPSPRNPRSKPRSQTAVLILTDVFGLDLVQNRLLVDSFARAGYLTIAPDLFDGSPAPEDINTPSNPSFNVTDFLARHNTTVTDPIISTTISYIRNQLKIPKIAAAGYCFGGRYAFRVINSPSVLGGADVAFTAHPSLLTDGEISGIEKPVAVAAADVDSLLTPAQRASLEGLLLERGRPYQVSTYGQTVHGFAVRANYSIASQKLGKEEAFLQAVRWFDRFLL